MPKFFSVIITIIIPLFLMPYATLGQSMQLVHLSGQAGLVRISFHDARLLAESGPVCASLMMLLSQLFNDSIICAAGAAPEHDACMPSVTQYVIYLEWFLITK